MIKNTLIILLGCLLFSTQLSAVESSPFDNNDLSPPAQRETTRLNNLKITPPKGQEIKAGSTAAKFNESIETLVDAIADPKNEVVRSTDAASKTGDYELVTESGKKTYLADEYSNFSTLHDSIINNDGGSSAKSGTLSFKVKRAINSLKKSFAKLFGANDKSEEAGRGELKSSFEPEARGQVETLGDDNGGGGTEHTSGPIEPIEPKTPDTQPTNNPHGTLSTIHEGHEGDTDPDHQLPPEVVDPGSDE
jgi:hypothetical protein